MAGFRKTVSSMAICPLARECRNNVCVFRADRVHGYPLAPSNKEERDKAKEIEKIIGKKMYVPYFTVQFRNGTADTICPDFTE